MAPLRLVVLLLALCVGPVICNHILFYADANCTGVPEGDVSFVGCWQQTYLSVNCLDDDTWQFFYTSNCYGSPGFQAPTGSCLPLKTQPGYYVVRCGASPSPSPTASASATPHIPTPGPPQWREDGQNAQHTRQSPYVGVQAPATASVIATAAADFTLSPPAIGADGTLYVAVSNSTSFSTQLLAVDPAGVTLWQLDIIFNTAVTVYLYTPVPAIADDGLVYFAVRSMVYAVEGSTGAVAWQIDDASVVGFTSPVIGPAGTRLLYLGTASGTLYALDTARGVTVWTAQCGSDRLTEPAIAGDGTLYVVSLSSGVFAVNGTTAVILWSYEPYAVPRVDPVTVGAGVVFLPPSYQGDYTYALNGTTGSLLWRAVNGYSGGPLALSDSGILYLGVQAVVAIDAATGSTLWQSEPNPLPGYSALSIGQDGTVYSVLAQSFRTTNVTLLAFAGRTGALKWSFPASKSTGYATSGTFAPVISRNGTLYVVTVPVPSTQLVAIA